MKRIRIICLAVAAALVVGCLGLAVFADNYNVNVLKESIGYASKAYNNFESNTYGYTEPTWEAAKAAYEAAVATRDACENQSLGSVEGYADQDTIDAANSALIAAVASLRATTANEGNIALNGICLWDDNDDALTKGWCTNRNYRFATDGAFNNDNRSWQPKSSKNNIRALYIILVVSGDMDKLTTYTEASNNVYDIYYITDTVTQSSYEELHELDTWLPVSNVVLGTPSGGSNQVQRTYSFDKVEGVTAIKLVCRQSNIRDIDDKNIDPSGQPKLWEVSATALPMYDVSKIAVATSVAEKTFGSFSNNSYGYSTETWSAAKIAYDTAIAAKSATSGKVLGSVVGYPTQDTINDIAEALETAMTQLRGTISGTNVFENGIMFWEDEGLQYSDNINLLTLTDGVLKKDGNCWQNSASKKSVYIVLKQAADINKIKIYSEASDSVWSISYITGDVTATSFNDLALYEWTDTDAHKAGYTKIESGCYEQVYFFNKIENVTAIKITHVQNGYRKLWEVQGENTKSATNVLDASEVVWDTENLASYADGIFFRTLSDGVLKNNNNNVWQPNSSDGAVFYLILDEAADLHTIIAYTESQGEKYNIEYCTTPVTDRSFEALGDLTYSSFGDRDSSVKIEDSLYKQTYIGTAPAIAVTALKFTCTTGGWVKVYEVEGYRDVTSLYFNHDNEVYANDEGDYLVITDMKKMPQIAGFERRVFVTVSFEKNGQSYTEEKEVRAAYSSICFKKNESDMSLTMIDATDLGGSSDDYLTGVIIRNVPDDVNFTVSFRAEYVKADE